MQLTDHLPIFQNDKIVTNKMYRKCSPLRQLTVVFARRDQPVGPFRHLDVFARERFVLD